ncbi:MAG: hypothetical protein ACXWUG_30855 [Polyangiales bacterium]
MERVFVERWHDLEENVALDVWFVPDLARYEVIAGELLVYSSANMSEILFWCMGKPVPEAAVEPIDLSFGD